MRGRRQTLSTDWAIPSLCLFLPPLSTGRGRTTRDLRNRRRRGDSHTAARSSSTTRSGCSGHTRRPFGLGISILSSSHFTPSSKFDHSHCAIATNDQVTTWQEDDVSRCSQTDDAFVGRRTVWVGFTRCGWWVCRGFRLLVCRRQTVYLLEQERVCADLSGFFSQASSP